jgi:hypothetical protein
MTIPPKTMHDQHYGSGTILEQLLSEQINVKMSM